MLVMSNYNPNHSKLGSDGPATCFNCGKRAMVLKVGECRMLDGCIVPDVEYLECLACGEKLFDGPNTDKVVGYRKSLRRRSPKPKTLTYA
ncbi:MAG: hypothetical protein FJY65_12815 [Calditrichaeota bacterium]|nr:hypothetical protein [Calditrichota bacterium]